MAIISPLIKLKTLSFRHAFIKGKKRAIFVDLTLIPLLELALVEPLVIATYKKWKKEKT